MCESHFSTTVTYLEMTEATQLNARPLVTGMAVMRVAPPDPSVNRRMYQDVGGPWAWRDKLSWSDDQWRAYADREELETWIGTLDGVEIGYFELERQSDGNVQIQYFGLLPEFTDRGLGGSLLSAAIERAWAIPGTRRVWVHTCNHDHPAALPNYLKRGFRVYDEETY